jgi:hypothetical protein
VLVGLPELENRLAIRHNRSLYSRLHRRLRVSVTTLPDALSITFFDGAAASAA